MAISDYLMGLRRQVGNALLLVPSVTAIVFDDDNRILLARHTDANQWVAPGGGMEPNERPADAVVRETREETGLLVEPRRILGVYGGPELLVTYSNGDRVSYVMTVFECAILGGSPQPDNEETAEVGYFAESDLEGLELATWARVVLPAAYHRGAASHFEKASWQPANKSM